MPLNWPDRKPRKTPAWFALDGAICSFGFAGIWASGRVARAAKTMPVDGVQLYRCFFLTIENDLGGMVSASLDRAYHFGRSRDWLTKMDVAEDSFVIIG